MERSTRSHACASGSACNDHPISCQAQRIFTVPIQARQDRDDLHRTAAKAAPLFGVYDPPDRFRSSRQPAIEHVFVYWQALDKAMLTRKMRVAQEMGRTFMVTAEPYTKAVNWRDGGKRFFTDILAGKFDRQIADVCGAVAAFPGKQWIRWGHEMEDPSDRYPWARNDPAGYVAAYRYFVETCGKIAREARFIWSPKGEKQLAAY
jgi:beta-mannanase